MVYGVEAAVDTTGLGQSRTWFMQTETGRSRDLLN